MKENMLRTFCLQELQDGTGWTDGWMDDLRFYVPFNCISVISGRWKVQDGTRIDKARSALEIIADKGRPFSVFVDALVSHFALLHFYSSHLALSVSKHRGRIE